MTVKVKRCSVESVNTCSSLFLLKLHAWLYIQEQTVYVKIVKISLGKNKLSICRNNFLSFLCFTLTENVMNCFAHNLPLPPKRCMMFFCEQIELQVVNLFNHHILFQEYAPFKFVCIHRTLRFHFPPAWALNFDFW